MISSRFAEGVRDTEHFGFAKAMTYPEYWFCPRSNGSLRVQTANEGDKMLLHDLWEVYGNGVQRPLDRIFYILKSAGHEVLLLSDGTRWGYLAWKPQKRLVTEYCGRGSPRMWWILLRHCTEMEKSA